MNKKQKEVLLRQFKTEEEFLKELEKIYQQALDDINDKIKILQASDMQSKIYQRQYQEVLKGQVEAILEMLHSQEYISIEDYLDNCYRDAFIGALYDLHGQNIPLILPINQEQVVKALQLDSQISEGLYKRLGEDITTLKKTISEEISRGISSSLMYSDIARNIKDVTNIGFNNAVRIVRTEGHRIQVQSGMDACYKAKEKGCDVVKQWDSTLDKRTRDSHARVDGEIRELDKEFSNGLMFPGDPSGGASEVVNCRCSLLQRARWALDEDELNTLKERAEYYGLDKNDSFDDFKKKYLNAVEHLEKKNQKL